MEAPKPASGRYSPKVDLRPSHALQNHQLTPDPAAIEYIRSTQHTERQLANEVQRLQRDVDYGRDAHKENELLKTEVQVMHQTLKRLDPNAPHVYGHFTSQLSQPNGSSGISLPPLNPPGSSGRHEYGSSHASAPSASQQQQQPAAMQGVEYGYGRERA